MCSLRPKAAKKFLNKKTKKKQKKKKQKQMKLEENNTQKMEDRTTCLSACTCQGRSAETESHKTLHLVSRVKHNTHGLYMRF